MPKKKSSKAALKKRAKKQGKPKGGNANNNKGKSKAAKSNGSTKKKHSDQAIIDLFTHHKDFNRDISIDKLTVEPINGGADLIEECQLKLTHGHRYGLIGLNGAGKSTLLKKLASGHYSREIPSYLLVHYSGQEIEGSALTVLETVLKSDKKREYLLKWQSELKAEMDALEASNKENQQNGAAASKPPRKLDDIVTELEDCRVKLKFIEADTAETRASALLSGLQFTESMKRMKTADLSGGWRMRVSLAASLLIEPDLLLLDEPTNHLDFPSVLWLADYLQFEYSAEKTIMIVSHDRRFLNQVCSDIMHLDRRKLHFYTGNYDAFVEIRKQARIHQKKQYDKQQAVIAHNKEFIAKFAANKKWSTQAQSRQKLLDNMVRDGLIEKVVDDLSFRFEFPKPPNLRNPSIFRFDHVSFGYFGEDRPKAFILKDICLRFNYGDKVGIVGANGAGKSTLIKLIMNKVQPCIGAANLTNQVQIGYFSQHHIDDLDLNATPLQQLEKEFGSANVTRQQLYAQLGRFNLGKETAERKIGTLSGGQKSRVTFAILTWWRPHLIIMDEPTNHLDMPTIEGLAHALKAFDGSVLVVSHDQHFVETCCSEFWCVGNRKIKIFNSFKKCISFSKTCKATNLILPRDYNEQKEEEKKAEPEKKAEKKKPVAAAAIEIDVVRQIEKGLAKGLSPNGILRHCKGWLPVDAQPKSISVVNKLGFLVFPRWFESDDAELDHFAFFAEWRDLVRYCVPDKTERNQLALLEIGVSCFMTARRDGKRNATKAYAFGLVLEAAVARHAMLSVAVLKRWLAAHGADKDKAELVQQMRQFIVILEEDAQSSDSDSDSD